MPQKSRGTLDRGAVAGDLDWALRELSTSTILWVSAIAQRVGLSPNDLKCAELLVRKGPMTAGDLARESGLTTGAITGVVDRLEKAGWARREPDKADRRRVIIHGGPKETTTLDGLYDSYSAALATLLLPYADDELAVILSFVKGLSAINQRLAMEESS